MKLLSRIFGRTKTTQAVSDLPTRAAAVKKILEAHASLNQIVNDFGATLASSAAPWPGCVADACKLPHPKEDIKRALMYFLLIVEDSQLRSALKLCYILLAQWQEGVGDTDAGFDFNKIDIRRVQELSHKPSLSSAESLEMRELAEWVTSRTPAREKWWPKVIAELDSLVDDLKDRGLWNP